MIKLYHAPLTRSIRIYWLLEELGLPYELSIVKFTPGKTPFAQATPYGKVPAIEDGDVVMIESGAILEYILEKSGQGRLAPAPGTAARPAFLQWVYFSEATVLPPVGDIVRHTLFKPEPERIPAVVEDARGLLGGRHHDGRDAAHRAAAELARGSLQESTRVPRAARVAAGVSQGPLLNSLPLDGVRVVDLSRMLAAPFAAALLGDLGV